MCGIAGIFHREAEPVDLRALGRMNDSLSHRGPDGEGYVLWEPGQEPRYFSRLPEAPPFPRVRLALANRRLSIIDLSDRGRQPMANEDGSIWVAFNGEIYNYLELMTELKGRGHRFQSSCDTEVILHAYEEWGEDCLARFNGMWAFALWDGRQKSLFCARDRFGIKPFYYFDDGRHFIFASEIKALFFHPAVQRRPNDQTIFLYLCTGSGLMDFTPETFFEGIHQIPPAHYLRLKEGNASLHRYWDLDENRGPLPSGDEEAAAGFLDLLTNAVRLRLRSDVPLGVCLSGGLDSSSLTCLARQVLGTNTLRTFSSCFDDPRYDEREFIEPVVDHTGAQSHYTFPKVEELFDLLPTLIWFQDEPFHNLNQFAQWYVMRTARENGVKVVLSGHGGDEILNGYPQDFIYLFADLLRGGHLLSVRRELSAYRALHGHSRLSALLQALKILASLHGPPSLKRAFRSALGNHSHHVLEPEFLRRTGQRPELGLQGGSCLRTATYMGLRIYPVPGWLHFEDRNSMAFSVESRIPLLDYRLVEYTYRLPGDQKIRDGLTKFVLRNALKGILPEVIRNRTDKKGFLAPTDLWMKEEMKERVRTLFSSEQFRARGYLKPEAVLAELDRHCRGEKNLRLTLWSWVNLELWFRQMIDSPPKPPAAAAYLP